MPYKANLVLSPRLNTAAVMCGQVLGSLGSLFLVALLTRRLSEDELALFLYVTAIATALEALTDLGLRFAAVQRQSDSRSDTELAKWTTIGWLVKLVLSALVVLGLFFAWKAGLVLGLGSRRLPAWEEYW